MVQVLPIAQTSGRLDARLDPAGRPHPGLGHGRHAEGLLAAVHDVPQR